MLTIEYHDNGLAIPDVFVEGYARDMCRDYMANKEDIYRMVSNETLILAFKLMVLEEEIPNNELQFIYKDDIITISRNGDLSHYPKGFCEVEMGILKKLSYFRRERSKKRNEQATISDLNE